MSERTDEMQKRWEEEDAIRKLREQQCHELAVREANDRHEQVLEQSIWRAKEDANMWAHRAALEKSWHQSNENSARVATALERLATAFEGLLQVAKEDR